MEPPASSIPLIAWQGWGTVGSVAVLAVLLAVILAWLLALPDRALSKQLNNPAGRLDLRARLGAKPVLESYRAAIRRLNAWLAEWFGPPWSGQAFERCVAIIFIFVVLLFLISLVVNGVAAGKVAPYQAALAVIAIAAFTYLMARVFRALLAFLQRFWRFIGGDEEIAPVIARVVLGAFAVILSFAIAFGIALAISGKLEEPSAAILAVAGGLSLAAAFVIAFAVAGAGAFVVLAALACGAVLGLASEFAFILLLFFVLLPVFNAVVDWCSWAVTRFFLHYVAAASDDAPGGLLMAAALLAACLSGLVFVVILAVLLPNAVELLNKLFWVVGQQGFDWKTLMATALQSPWRDGLFVTGMLVTPLIPAAVHLTIGQAEIYARWTPRAREAAAFISEHPDVNMPPSETERLQQTIMLARLWYIPAALVTLGLFTGLCAGIHYGWMPVSQVLSQTAICATSWSHGSCAWF